MGFKNVEAPTSFNVDGKTERSHKKLAIIQMNHYTAKISKLMSQLPKVNYDPIEVLRNATTRWGQNYIDLPTSGVQEVNTRQITDIINKLKPGTSFGHDQINTNTLKKKHVKSWQTL